MSEQIKATAEEELTPEVTLAQEAIIEAAPSHEDKAPQECTAASIAAAESAAEAEGESAPTPEEINAANAERSTGKVDDDGQGAAFFTAADVRAMSRDQVRRNLSKILKSMESDKF